MDKDIININLTQDQALVLFEFLARPEEKKKIEIQHPAEERVLWELQAYLEKQLVQPFKANYDALLESARKRLVA